MKDYEESVSIKEYLIKTYDPLAILLYGSYLRGDFDEHSDFDCVIIVKSKTNSYDYSVINGIMLECDIFTIDEVYTENPIRFSKFYASEVIYQKDHGLELAKVLKSRLADFIEHQSKTSYETKNRICLTTDKFINKAKRTSLDGAYRRSAYMFKSLIDYCLLRDIFYYGYKDTINYMKHVDYEGYLLYEHALNNISDPDIVIRWAKYVMRGV